MKEEPKHFIQFRPNSEWELKSHLLPNPREFKGKYSELLNKEVPLASIEDDFLIEILQKQMGLVVSNFLEMASRDSKLEDIAQWFAFRTNFFLLMTRSKKGLERKYQGSTGMPQGEQIQGMRIPMAEEDETKKNLVQRLVPMYE